MTRFAAVVLAAALAGCGDDGVRVYEIPKAKAPAPAAAPAGLHWHAPGGWVAKGRSGMRLETFEIETSGGTAELSVVRLSGRAGGMLANVNRWRGQLGLESITAEELGTGARRVESPAGEVRVVEFAGADGKERLLGGVLVRKEASWFFKMTGPAPAVREARGDYLAFLETVHD